MRLYSARLLVAGDGGFLTRPRMLKAQQVQVMEWMDIGSCKIWPISSWI